LQQLYRGTELNEINARYTVDNLTPTCMWRKCVGVMMYDMM